MRPLQPRRVARTAAVALAATVAFSLAPAPPVQGSVQSPQTRGRQTRSWQLAPGLVLKRVQYSDGPVEVRALIVNPRKVSASKDPSRALTIEPALASLAFPGWEKMSRIGYREGAIAAVNGDFSVSGRPIHPTAADADLQTAGLRSGVGFGVSMNEKRAFARRPQAKVTARIRKLERTWSIAHWNSGEPRTRQIAGYTQVGGSREQAPNDACAARLLPVEGRVWSDAQKTGISRLYKVDAQPEPCPFDPIATGSDPGAVVLAADRGGARAEQIKKLDRHDRVRITWSLGWNGVGDAIGGMPQLLEAGEVVAPSSCDSYFCGRNPRTGAGVNRECVTGDPGCRLYILTVDGRQSGWSVGMRLDEFAREFKKLGATWAVNFDGGGSTSMWVRQRKPAYCERRANHGCLVSRPSDAAGERSVENALLVLPGVDSNAPAVKGTRTSSRLASRPTRLVPGEEDPDTEQLILADPASTGGLLDAIAVGAFGRANLGPELSSALGAYRTAIAGPKD